MGVRNFNGAILGVELFVGAEPTRVKQIEAPGVASARLMILVPFKAGAALLEGADTFVVPHSYPAGSRTASPTPRDEYENQEQENE